MSKIDVKLYSLYENTGKSFNARTYSLASLEPYSVGTSIINTVKKTLGGKNLNSYSNSSLGIVCGSINDRALTPVTGDIISVNLLRYEMGNNNFGYYIHSISVNPALGTAFLRALSAEPVLQWICSKIQEEQSPYALTENTTFAISLPDLFKSLFIGPNQVTTHYGTFSIEQFPKINVYVQAGSIKVNNKGQSTLNPDAAARFEDPIFYYRNMDFYTFDFEYVDGEVALTTHAKEIESFFTQLNNGKKSIRETIIDSNVTDTPSYFGFNLFAYSGETYELATAGALVIGRAIGREDIVDDVLGRIRTDLMGAQIASPTEIISTYYQYLDSLTFSTTEYTSYRADIKILDKDLERARIADDNESKMYTHHLLDYIRYSYANQSKSMHSLLSPRVSYFHNLADRINMLRELAVLSMPTETVTYLTFSDKKHTTPSALNKPIVAHVKANHFLRYSLFLVHQALNDMDQTRGKENYLRYDFISKLAPSDVTGPHIYTDIFPVTGYGDDKITLDIQGIGDRIVDCAMEMNITSSFVDLRFLKQLFYSGIDTDEELCFDLSDKTFVYISENAAKGGFTQSYILPADWRHIQETLPYICVKSKGYNYRTYDFNSKSVKYQDTSPLFSYFMSPEKLSRIFKDYKKGDEDGITLKAPVGYDPVMNIRESLRFSTKEQSVNMVQGFSEELVVQSAPLSHAQLNPINYYALACKAGTRDIIYPMMGTYCKLGELPDVYESIVVEPIKEIYLDPTVDLSRNRRLI